MRSFSLPIAATLALFAIDSASAADLPSVKGEPMAPSIASCDFYQSQLIGAFCENTFGGTVTVDQEQLLYKAPVNTFRPSSLRDWFDPTASVYVAPTSWLKLSVTSQYNDYSYRYVNPIFGSANQSSRLSNIAWQTADATVRLLDYNGAGFRAFVSATGLVSFLPSANSYGARTEFVGELNAGVHWVLGSSDYSLDPHASLTLAHYTDPGQNQFATSVRLLLSQDVWGVAAGPIVTTSAINYHATNGNAFQSQIYYAGGHLLVEPFRLAGTPVLKEVVANFDILHSLGRAGTVYDWIPNTDEMIYKGSLQFNFNY
jgi:hypothetical protein